MSAVRLCRASEFDDPAEGFSIGKTVESKIDVVEPDMVRDQFVDGKAALTVPIYEAWNVVLALIALDARVHLVGPDGERSIPVEDLYRYDGIAHLMKVQMTSSHRSSSRPWAPYG